MNEQRKSQRQSTLQSSSERRQRVVPLAVQLSGIALNLLSRLSNRQAAKVLARLWFTTFRSKPKPWVAEFWRGADRCVEVAVEETTIDMYCWGQGPPVVLMHGWSGSGSQFQNFIEPLVAAGFTAVCFDAPEHGAESGRQTHMLRFSATLLAIQRELGEIDTVIAHSLGAMATTYTRKLGLEPARLVLIAPQLDAEELFDNYGRLLKLRPALARLAREKIGERLRELLNGSDPWETLCPSSLVGDPTLCGQLVYDLADPEVPPEHFRDILANWSQCTPLETRGLGHNRILRDRGVIGAVVDYLRG